MKEFKSKDVWWYKDFLFFKQWHGQQKYSDGLPYWHHLYLVASLLESALIHGQEVNEETRKVMVIAALGHDSLEDTSISPAEIVKNYGANVLEFIRGMTNEKGDQDITAYEHKILHSIEEVRLIKLADSCDNYFRMAQRVQDNTPEWLAEHVWPLMDNLSTKLITASFLSYPKTTSILKNILIVAKDVARRSLQCSKKPDNTI